MQKLHLVTLGALFVCGMTSHALAQNETALGGPNLTRLLITAPQTNVIALTPTTEIYVSRPYTARVLVPAARDEKFVHAPPSNHTSAMPIIGPKAEVELVRVR